MDKKMAAVWCGRNRRAGTGTNPAIATYRRRFENRETPMNKAKIALVGSAALMAISSVALAQQALTGTITKIDRISGTVSIRQTQSGTVGANSGGAAEEFKAQESLLTNLHAGDRVAFSATETGGKKTIEKLERQ
jgi:Cu/Ag efflux protein CusF